ncbi:hypothetical protein [Pseudomonas sp.]|uniref:DUF7696 family protein n=1 Tax=Pseudomonas sp. TaxID=306 RepID=UPI00257C9D0D|nr:hypothetical protein [Pseudomonas sp.]
MSHQPVVKIVKSRSVGRTAEQTLLACEARTWLSKGYDTPERIAELTALITNKRGAAAAQMLVDEMRRQWRNRGHND